MVASVLNKEAENNESADKQRCGKRENLHDVTGTLHTMQICTIDKHVLSAR
jgi:hypothetical protein